MKRIAKSIGLITVCLCVMQAPVSATDKATFDKAVARVAPDGETLSARFKPKSLCLCKSTLAPGVLALGHGVMSPPDINCLIPQFNADGSISGFAGCTGDFLVLGH